MAKLPEITYKRGAAKLHSAKAAGVEGDLRAVAARAKVVSEGVGVANKLLESEAKLNATAKMNAAQRDYARQSADLTQQYHTDTSKSPEDFAAELEGMREKTLGQINNSLGGRAQKYFRESADRYRTQVMPSERAAVQKLTESRTVMHLTDLTRDSFNDVADNPEMWSAHLAMQKDTWENSGLPAPAVQEGLQNVYDNMAAVAVNAFIRDGEVESAVAYQRSAAYTELSPDQRAKLDTSIGTAAQGKMAEAIQEDINLLIAGTQDINQAFTNLEATAASLNNFEGAAMDEYVKEQKGVMAFGYLSSMNFEGDYQGTLDKLKSGQYAKYMTAEQTMSLRRAAEAGLARGGTTTDLFINRSRAQNSATINNTLTALDLNPGMNVDLAKADAMAAFTRIVNSYLEVGKTVPKDVWAMEDRINAAADTAKLTQNYMINPNSAVNLEAVPEDVDGTLNREIRRKAVDARGEMLLSDPIAFARNVMGYDAPRVSPDLMVVAPAQFASELNDVFGVYNDQLANTFGEGALGGVLGEQTPLFNQNLSQLHTQGAMWDTLGMISDEIGTANMNTLVDELTLDSSTGLLPMAVSAYAHTGNQAAAEGILAGEAAFKGGFKLKEESEVYRVMNDELGAAYGSEYFGDTPYALAIRDAIKANYAGKLFESGDRSGDFDKDILKQSITEVTGGIFTARGRKFVSPGLDDMGHPVTEEAFNRWMLGLADSPDLLPDMIDGNGKTVPAAAVSEGMYDDSMFTRDRFMLVDSGRAGEYFIIDMRGLGMDGHVHGQPGSLMRSKEDPSRPAIITYTRADAPGRNDRGGFKGAVPTGPNP